jgi:molybdopterin-guanine dinucleotide biosynthesis protein A
MGAAACVLAYSPMVFCAVMSDAAMSFSAVILAGGKSTRMGRDKAWLAFQGQPLIERQIKLVRSIQPEQIFISAAEAAGFTQLKVIVLGDTFAGQGPLAGIEAALSVMPSPRLLVLAVDMPHMTLGTLQWLLARPGAGVVPRLNERLEPLAAVYPATALPLLRELLRAGRNAAREFVEQAVRQGLVTLVDVPPGQAADFMNCNSSSEWAAACLAP